MRKLFLFLTLMVVLALLAGVAVLQGGATPQAAQAAPPAQGPDVEVPFLEEWMSSGHADAEAEAFVHWDEEGAVPANCAKCHGTPGFLDFVGVDGSEAGTVDADAPIGSTVTCVACHNEATMVMDSVMMPSGAIITNLGAEARCMQCHQGRASKVQVDAQIEELGLSDDPDAASADLGFTNIHYYAAAATKYGTLAMGGYEYEGKSYDGNFNHVDGYNTCIGCHNAHSLEVKVEECAACHAGVEAVEDLRDVRLQGSLVDYDGDGDLTEGIYYEIQTLQEMLLTAIQAYGQEVAGTPIGYNPASHPYFFIDGDASGEIEEAEAVGDNAYNAWTPRLTKAAYNYQVSVKDPGQYAHGGKYIIQLLFDSIEDLNQSLEEPIALEGRVRIDHGHFAGSEEAFRHWDAEGMVETDCVKCHTAVGLPMFLQNGTTISVPPSNGLECSTCHSDLTTFALYEVEAVEFPSGAVLSFEDSMASNLCLECHQGRESTVSVNNLIADQDLDAVSDQLRFLNVHYFAAGATLFGSEAQGAYQFEGKDYVGQFTHVPNFDTCIECHNAHELRVEVEGCSGCHQGVETEEDLRNIRMSGEDYDGDGDTEEGIAGEIETMREKVLEAMHSYAQDATGNGIIYAPLSYPYFFIDSNGDAIADADEINGDNRFVTWTPRLLQAAYNYQYSGKDPGAFAHNGKYILQVLYDSLEALSEQVEVDMTGLVRPES